ncbi:calcium-binding EGF domain-containing protein [Ditylenchus destructor]|nr:calcium-binding EGF domain-containing protein [Ditylenchus destructor]
MTDDRWRSGQTNIMHAFRFSRSRHLLYSIVIIFAIPQSILASAAGTSNNPCQDYSLHDCDPVAECHSEQPGYFQCRCPKGFVDVSPDKRKTPGRKCLKEVNECELGLHECDTNADCVDTPEGYSCRCKAGWTDVSASIISAPGRQCKRSDLCQKADCAPEAECRESETGAVCQCTSGFVDISKQHGRPAGRVCRVIVNECAEHKHDCSANSICIDTAESFTCRCSDGYRDDSPNQDRPGRICAKAAVPDAPECNVNDPMSCDKQKHEVCLFVDGNYKCACPSGYNRLPDGRCLAINECETRLSDCSADADCIDQAEGYTCQCKSGFADVSPENSKPGRLCRRRVNECAKPQAFGVDCDSNAVCVDTEEGYSCRSVNECLDQKLNDCAENAICEDAKEGYTCACPTGYVDASPNSTQYPGRVCNKKPDEGLPGFQEDEISCDPHVLNACGPNAICNSDHKCECQGSTSRYYDNMCHKLAACESNDCDKNAACTNVFGSYKCQCQPGYYDASPDPETKPGRICTELVNECATGAHDCSPFAHCVDSNEGYSCSCTEGFVDTSSQHGLAPGRRCSNASNECLEKSLNTCDENADCVDTADGYTCQCLTGYVDVSSNAHLPPGRVCTVQTSCPKQKTDLMFLIDGSGSIGSYVFKNEVLRFVRDFLELFDVGLDNTRVGLIQYSDQIRHEFDLNQYGDKQSLLQALAQTQYLTGLTRTGAAIQHMVVEGFAERRGARPVTKDVSRVAIVITDGRSQDNVTEPSKAARNLHVNTFAIGVTDHVLASELESIAGSPNRWFYVDRFKDLDMRLRSIIQKLACPAPEHIQRSEDTCNPQAQTGCDRSLNKICAIVNGIPTCQCPKEFQPHPITRICGGELCNPDLPTSCPHPEICHRTPFGNHRCLCPANYARDMRSGVCISTQSGAVAIKPVECPAGFERNPRNNKCIVPGSCDPTEEFPCDLRKRERCLLHASGRYHICQCANEERRHPITQICLVNECMDKNLNDCAPDGKCIDTDDGYICACPNDAIDQSPDPINKPGRICSALIDECAKSMHHCMFFAKYTTESYKCICKHGFQDLDELRNPGRHCEKAQQDELCATGRNDCDKNARCSQNGNDFRCACPQGYKDKSTDPVNKPGRVCIPVIPECDNPSLNDCDSPDRAICTDTDDGYLCRCRQGYLDISPNIANRPGRLCKQLTNECALGIHDCSRDGGICEDTPDSYTCRCAINYLDVSPDRNRRPGRKCKKLVDECARGLSDCSPDALCMDTEDSYICQCPPNFIDVSPDIANRPGRRCQPNINECTKNLHDCSPNANCIDTPESFTCKCGDDFVDESPDPMSRSGRICRPALVDECRVGKHDCHPDAECHDLPQGYTCQCRVEFLDESPNRITHPGRMCVPRPTPPPDECQVDRSTSCKVSLNEVCRLVGGVPKCACPINYNRDPATQACTVINECQFPQLNDCHPSAECIDQPTSFTCKCREGMRDLSQNRAKPGRICQPMINECRFPHLNDCHQNAQCIDLDEGYQCKCNQGFKDLSPERPGRICQQLINECSRPELNSCDKNARCTDMENGYKCECNANFLDVSPSPTLPGRACRPIVNECADPKLNDCDKMARCVDTIDSYTCECPSNSRDISPNPVFPGRVCLVFENECLTGRHDCDPSAICHDNEQSFSCECQPSFTDRSPNKLNRPGRVCVKLVDECKEGRHTCSPQAECRDLEEGYTCECKDGYVDRSPNLLTQPGRVCGTPETCPHTHECSSAAVCEPLGGNQYKCSCIQGYVDQSPEGKEGRICVRHGPCRDPALNNCSRNAICFDEQRGYRCECARGYLDKSPDPSVRGRVCEAKPPPHSEHKLKHPCQDPILNDCHTLGACRATGGQTFTCECLSGYADRSPDRNKPGRVCVLTEPICLDPNLNDCDPSAICSESKGTPDGYTCRCRDGYVDQSPNKAMKPGRMCIEQINECLDRSLNDCDPIAVCEDLPEGYTCRCPLTSIDQSPDRKRPGRKCVPQINECANPTMMNCSKFADCIDKQVGYECRCRNGYHDENPSVPGTVCRYIINECEFPNLNDCDKHADCIDLPGGYDCKCRSPYRDDGPRDKPGRRCIFNECLDPKSNDCPSNSMCIDTDDGYMCECKEGFYSTGPKGECIAFNLPEGPTIVHRPDEAQSKTTPAADTFPCGPSRCKIPLGEVCVSGSTCDCKPGENRISKKDKCQLVDNLPYTFRVTSRNQQPLFYSSEFGDKKKQSYVEFSELFEQDLGRAIGGTTYAPRYVNTDVSFITHPKTVNSSWSDGLLVNFNVSVTPNKPPVDRCDLWDKMMDSLQRTNGAIGSGELGVAPDVDLLNPCVKPPPPGDMCGGVVCNAELGEVCIASEVCGCPAGEKRSSPKEHCRQTESWTIPLWVIRKNQHNLVFNETFANPMDNLNKEYVKSFEDGIAECYPQTELKNAFVVSEVNDIVEPRTMNGSWATGVIFNSTMHFRKGAVRVPSDAYNVLVRYIIDRNSYQVGHSGLYLNPYQQSPFGACANNNCHPMGICIELGPNAYRCECSQSFRDLNPADPGRKCLPTKNYNECERKEDNQCSEFSRCIDLDYLYKCECLQGYSDAAPKGAVPGSVCVLDYCSDVNFCPANSTCRNLEQQAECQCNRGFVDIRPSPMRLHVGLHPDTACLNIQDVNECALKLTNCTDVAICTDLKIGYTCACPSDYKDQLLSMPGRICAATQSNLCNLHGGIVHDANTNTTTCLCTDGYAGEFCEVAPSNVPLILLILLALLFLLLTLCCLLYLCTKCHCFKRRRAFPWSTLDQSNSSESGADLSDLYNKEIGIPRAQLKSEADSNAAQLARYLDENLRIPRAHLHDSSSLASGSSEYTIREEIERRVTTDVTKTELRTVTTEADVHNEVNETTTTSERATYYPAGASGATSAAAQNVTMRSSGGAHFEEQERGESVAEFANSQQRTWHQQSRAQASGSSAAGYGTVGHHVGEDDRSIGAYSEEEDGQVYDKAVLMKRHHEVDPSSGAEKFRSEVTKTKNVTETFHK